jgi:glycosyltransferase involved in cell wall biosynthesis
MAFFSIIISVFNGEKDIERCLFSCSNQTFKDISIACVDDGSTDNTKSIIQKFVLSDNRIKLFCNDKNESLMVSRFKPISEIVSNYVLFLDSDDELMSTACEELYKILSIEHFDILEFKIKFASGKYTYILEKQDFLKRLLTDIKYPHSVFNKVYKYEVLVLAKEEVAFFYCNMGEDIYLSIALNSLGENRSFLDKELYLYNDINGMSTRRNNRELKELLSIMDSAMSSLEHSIEFVMKYNHAYKKYINRFSRNFQCQVLNFIFSHANLYDFNKIIKTYKQYKGYNNVLLNYISVKRRIVNRIRGLIYHCR